MLKNKTYSEQKVKEYKDTIKKLEARNEAIKATVSEDQAWIKAAEVEQKVRQNRISENLQEMWQTEGQIKTMKEWLEVE